jgi:uncharacterized protein with NAD-binding domain and iron-sulfur cluster
MAKRKVAILGGGMAGLTAAYELTRTPQLRERHEVTIYQMGWRLGGKAASSRDTFGRILEHGLHVWFGCYENAFGLIREVYKTWDRDADCPLKTWRDAFVPQDCTPIGDRIGGRYSFHPVQWPRRSGQPGDGAGLPTLWESSVVLLELARNVARAWSDKHPDVAMPGNRAPQWALDQYDKFFATSRNVERPAASLQHDPSGRFADVGETVEAALAWARSFDGSVPHVINKRHSHHGIIALLRTARDHVQIASMDTSAQDIETRVLEQLLDVVAAFLNGLFSDLIIDGKTIDQLDALEFRAWLMRHGGSPLAVEESALVKSLYDTMFQYEDGDPARPSYAAGTAAQVVLRIVATYKEAALYLMTAGMGEVVVAPLYETLKGRGVKFRFFRKVSRLEIDKDANAVEKIYLERQADVVKGDEYAPTFKHDGLVCWPDRPDWKQIVGGAAMAKAKVDFESHWCQWPSAGQEMLSRGADFHDVILAMSLGAFKRLGAAPAPCDALIEASDAFRRMTVNAGLVPSQAVQLWCSKTASALGWPYGRATTVSGAPPLDIWADMTPTLVYEPRRDAKPPPQSVHYFCSVLNTQLYRRPPNEAETPARAGALVADNVAHFLERGSDAIWPRARTRGDFNWNILYAPQGVAGSRRLDSQYVRANVNPTDCCVGSAKGTTAWRLRADNSGFTNLYLAGCWTRTGMNTTCIESAVMAGRQASRAICGSPANIPGENFLRSVDIGAESIGCLTCLLGPFHFLFVWLQRRQSRKQTVS